MMPSGGELLTKIMTSVVQELRFSLMFRFSSNKQTSLLILPTLFL
jgi:hypothetical protein